MECLSAEVCEIIASQVAQTSSLASLAAVSQLWQANAERHTFRNIRLKSSDLDPLDEILQNRPDRRRNIRLLRFIVVLPAYPEQKRAIFENDDDRASNNRAFTIAIVKLLKILSHGLFENGQLVLRLEDVYSTTDHTFLHAHATTTRPDEPDAVEGYFADDGDEYTCTDLYNWRHRYCFLDLDHQLIEDLGQLPQVPAIRDFILSVTTRNIADHVPVVLAAQCMPNLVSARWRLICWDIKYLTPRREYRALLSQAVLTHFVALSKLETLTVFMNLLSWGLDSFDKGDISQGISNVVLPPRECTESRLSDVPNEQRFDILSSALRIGLSKLVNLRDFMIGGVMDSSLFTDTTHQSAEQPEQDKGPGVYTQWGQSLEYLHVSFDARRPQGGAYFRMAGPSLWGPADFESSKNIPTEDLAPGYSKMTSEEAVALGRSFDRRDHRPGPAFGDFPIVVDEKDGEAMGISSLLAGFATACAGMPNLKRASISTWLPVPVAERKVGVISNSRRLWGVWYAVREIEVDESRVGRSLWFRSPDFFGQVDKTRVIWDTPGWRPSEKLRDLFGTIGRSQRGDDVVQVFASSEHI